MNRREVMCGLGALSISAVTRSGDKLPMIFEEEESRATMQAGLSAMPPSIAGVRLVDSEIARLATDLSRSVSPAYLFNHAMRTYLFGSLVGRALGQKFDDEILYLASILHDLGLTERFQGDLPFEIQGAEVAKHFLEENAFPRERTETLWDGIAMPASAIGQLKRPEIALVGEGTGADVLRPDFSRIKKSGVAEILK